LILIHPLFLLEHFALNWRNINIREESERFAQKMVLVLSWHGLEQGGH
jgi:hypothetical protein